jgi:hypothetical protein
MTAGRSSGSDKALLIYKLDEMSKTLARIEESSRVFDLRLTRMEAKDSTIASYIPLALSALALTASVVLGVLNYLAKTR